MPAISAPAIAERVRRLPATENRWTRSLFLLFSIMKAASEVWCRLPKNAPAAGAHNRISSFWVLIMTTPITAPMPSPRMNDALRPMRSETRPAGIAVTALAMKPIMRRRPMNLMSNPAASRYRLKSTVNEPWIMSMPITCSTYRLALRLNWRVLAM